MTIQNTEKLKNLLKQWPHGLVATTTWLEQKNISRANLQNYTKSGWINRIGVGAYKRPEDNVNWQNGLEALQQQLGLNIHIGGKTSLNLQGYGHYLRFGSETIELFVAPKTIVPKWFKNNSSWEGQLRIIESNFLPPDTQLIEHRGEYWVITISSPERAILEALYTAPKTTSWIECYELLEGLNTLRPTVLTQLLETITSVKVKRVFLYMADKLQHPWYKHINTQKIDLGRGERMLEKGGVYIPEFKLVVPIALAEIK